MGMGLDEVPTSCKRRTWSWAMLEMAVKSCVMAGDDQLGWACDDRRGVEMSTFWINLALAEIHAAVVSILELSCSVRIIVRPEEAVLLLLLQLPWLFSNTNQSVLRSTLSKAAATVKGLGSFQQQLPIFFRCADLPVLTASSSS